MRFECAHHAHLFPLLCMVAYVPWVKAPTVFFLWFYGRTKTVIGLSSKAREIFVLLQARRTLSPQNEESCKTNGLPTHTHTHYFYNGSFLLSKNIIIYHFFMLFNTSPSPSSFFSFTRMPYPPDYPIVFPMVGEVLTSLFLLRSFLPTTTDTLLFPNFSLY